MKSFLRFLSNHKLYAVAEICGFSVAIAFVVLVGSFVLEDNKCDRSTKNADRLFMLYQGGDALTYDTEHMGQWGNRIRQISSVESLIPVIKTRGVTSNLSADVGNGQVDAVTALAVGEDFFDAFGFRLVTGNPSEVLASPVDIVVSREYANRVFGDADPLGREIEIIEKPFGYSRKYNVAGVYESNGKTIIPSTDVIFRCDEYYHELFKKHSIVYPTFCFVLLKEGCDLKQAEADFADIDYRIEPLRSQHHKLYKLGVEEYFDNLSDYDTFKLFLLSCIVLLVFAILGYVILSMAFSRFRIKEMATRRLLGTSVPGVVARCIGESYILLGFSFVAGVLLALACSRPVSDLLELDFRPLSSIGDWGLLALSFVVIGFAAGVAPAIAVSKYRPVAVIKGEVRTVDKMFFGKFVVGLQSFVCVCIVAICFGFVFQIDRMIHFPRGYEPGNNIFVKEGRVTLWDEPRVSLEEIASLPCVESVGKSYTSPASKSYITIGLNKGAPDMRRGKDFLIRGMVSSSNVFDMLGIKVLEDFQTPDWDGPKLYVCKSSWENFVADTDSLPVYYGEQEIPVAVIEDLKFGEINTAPSNGIVGYICSDKEDGGYPFIRVKGDENEALKAIKELYESKGILDTVSIQTLNQEIAEHYKQERKYAGIMLTFGILSILLTCLGLIALGSYWTQLRTGDTAVRKVFGCTPRGVFIDTVRSFAIPISIGAFLAIPPAFIYLERWLEQYVIRIDNSLWIYVLAVGVVFLLAFASISVQAVRLMNTNPAEVLKKE